MKTKYYLLLLIPLVPAVFFFFKWSAEEAHNTSDAILREFKKVNDSIKPSLSEAENISLILDSLRAEADTSTIIQATTLVRMKESFDGLVAQLREKYPIGANEDSIMVINPDEGTMLYERMMTIHRMAKANIKDEGRKEELQDMFRNVLRLKDGANFTNVYFNNSPIVATHVLWSKFNHDVEHATFLTLTDIMEQTKR